MAQVNFDWVTAVFTEGDDDYSELDVTGPATLQVYLIDGPDLEDKGDTLRVERVVGSVWYKAISAAGWNAYLGIAERIYVAELDFNNNTTIHALWNAGDLDRDFLWERRRVLGPEYLTGYNFQCLCTGEAVPSTWEFNSHNSDPYWTQVDVRVARRLKDREVLCYQVSIVDLKGLQVDPGDITLHIGAWMRVGVRF